MTHRIECPELPERGSVPLSWDKEDRKGFRDLGAVELEMVVDDGPGTLYAILAPFKALGLDIRNLRLPRGGSPLAVEFRPETARTLNRLIRALRKHAFVRSIRVFRAMGGQAQPAKSDGGSSRKTSLPSPSTE